MGLLNFFTIYVFSEMKGVVTLNGEPVAGAELVRTADHVHDRVYTDSTVTDEAGRFSFPDIKTFSLRPLMLPTVIHQKMIIRYQGMEYLAWETTKRTNHRHGEINDEKPDKLVKLDLSCELTDDQNKKTKVELEIMNRIVTGLCRW